MKKTILLLLTLLLSIVIYSQDVWLRSSRHAYSLYNSSTEQFMPWSDWKPVSILIYVDGDNDIVHINNELMQKFYLNDPVTEAEKIDEDGDIYTSYLYTAYDEQNLRCFFVLQAWNNYNLCHVYIYYRDIKYVYECVTIDSE